MMSIILYFLHYLFAMLLLFGLLAGLIFVKNGEEFLDIFFSNFSRMVFLIIVVSYILVIIKLFEFISIFAIMMVLIIRKFYFTNPENIRIRKLKDIRSWITDYIEGIIDLQKVVLIKIKRKMLEKQSLDSWGLAKILFLGTLIFTIIYSLLIRLYDAFANAAPAMSDAYVTLAWAKYIDNRILFYDGIYPQGFHIYLAVMKKFSSIDMLYVLKFTGPIVSFLIALGIYFSVSRFLKCKYSGFIAGAAYGLFGLYFTGSLERQTATNSQEFAFLFIMPCLYFFYKYAKSKSKEDFYVAGAAFAVIGLVHALAFIYTAIGIIVLGISFLIHDFFSLKKVFWKILGLCVFGGLVAVIPMGVGLIMGKGFHGASVDFIQETNFIPVFPTLIISDYLSMIAAALCLLLFFFRFKDKATTAYLFLVLFWAMSFCLYYYGGHITDSLIVETRARELFAIASPVIIGGGAFSAFEILKKFDYKGIMRPVVSSVLVIWVFALSVPVPIIPYKMEYNSPVEQYIVISENYRPTEWLIVSQEEGYAMVYGRGWHLMTGDFLKEYTGNHKGLIGDSSDEKSINVPNVFIFHEKQIYKTYKEMDILAKAYDRRMAESLELGNWINKNMGVNDRMSLFYEDDYLAVYHLLQEEVYAEIKDRVNGPT